MRRQIATAATSIEMGIKLLCHEHEEQRDENERRKKKKEEKPKHHKRGNYVISVLISLIWDCY